MRIPTDILKNGCSRKIADPGLQLDLKNFSIKDALL